VVGDRFAAVRAVGRLVACIVVVLCLSAAGAPYPDIELQAISEHLDSTAGDETSAALNGLEEMLGNVRRPRRWTDTPALTILGSVMDYRPGNGSEYIARSERLSESEIDEIAGDLTSALHVLSAGKFSEFASVSVLPVQAGSTANVAKAGHIVVGRFKGLRQATKAIGLGGRRTRKDRTISAGLIILDSEYDQTNANRHLLRTHELGHALGYNHVHSRKSIMNLHLGSPPNAFDHEAALIAFGSGMPIVPPRH
jgi:hypothetical protein